MGWLICSIYSTARQKKAIKIFPRPTAGALRPIVHGQTLKYNMKVRAGRGFTLEELKVSSLELIQISTFSFVFYTLILHILIKINMKIIELFQTILAVLSVYSVLIWLVQYIFLPCATFPDFSYGYFLLLISLQEFQESLPQLLALQLIIAEETVPWRVCRLMFSG